jgi:hypothetical protein
MVVVQANETPEPKTAIELLAARIRTLINVTGLSREDCHETIMSTRNPPSEEEFHLAYSAAVMLANSDQRADHAAQMAILVPAEFRNT